MSKIAEMLARKSGAKSLTRNKMISAICGKTKLEASDFKGVSIGDIREMYAEIGTAASSEFTHLSIPIGGQTMFVNLKAGNGWIEGDTGKAIAALRKAFPDATSVYRARKGK